jgi:CRP/FNR family transcriptional regulator, cyclic AMP receptor protein
MAGVSDVSMLETMPLFRELTRAQLERINQQLHRRTFPAGTHLMAAEQPGDVVYVILDGTVKIHVTHASGNEVILGLRGAGETIGEMSVVESVGQETVGRSADVVTLERSTLLWIERTTFVDWLQAMPIMGLNLARILSRRLRLATAQLQVFATQDVFGRVSCQLLAIAQEYGDPVSARDLEIPLRLTQSDLASMVGASRMRVNQVLGHYKDRGYISISTQFRITIHDSAALAQRCDVS